MRLKLQIPNHKFQTKGQIQNSKRPLPGVARGFWFFLFRDFAFVWSLGFVIWNLGFVSLCLCGERDVNEFQIKRQEVFEFAEKPAVTRDGDQVTITFVSKGFCDATVAIEDAAGTIIRHLASGVLGPKAPEPFQKDSLKQTVLWDGKDDQGRYVDDKNSATVRVSLGLRPRFERNLYWSPYKRISQAAALIQASEEGVFLCEGSGVDSIRMFDHQGNYVRTVYPFPAGRYEQVKGFEWRDFPQGGRLPLKKSLYQQTLLTSGDNCNYDDQLGRSGRAATGMAVLRHSIALVHLRLNRLATDAPLTLPSPQGGEGGVRGGAALQGGKTGLELRKFVMRDSFNNVVTIGPTSAAISPDGKWLYMAGYAFRFPYNFDTLHVVTRMPLDGVGVEQAVSLPTPSQAGQPVPQDAAVFAGRVEIRDGSAAGFGSQPGEFRNACAVDCDGNGRVYVADFMNDRIQIFSPEGVYLKEVKCFKPALVRVNRRSGEMFVFSWMVPSRLWSKAEPPIEVSPVFTRFGPFDDPKELARYDLPMGNVRVRSNGKYGTYVGLPHALWFNAELDFWTTPPTIWLSRECRNDNEAGVHPGDGGQTTPWEASGIKLLQEKDGKLEIVRDFGQDTVKQVVRAKPPTNAIQRLEVNPASGKLYIGEADSGPTIKASNQLLEVDPETGKIRVQDLPFNAMEFAFDLNGLIYLRNTDMIARYDTTAWREVPWDYGEERKSLGNDGGIMGKTTPVRSALAMPSKSPVCYHQGGIHVSPKGYVIASCAYRFVGVSGGHFQLDKAALPLLGKEYQPLLYPGRISNSTAPCIHVWDKHGQLVYEDALPGVGQVDGVAMDRDDSIYLMHTPTRVLGGKKYFNEMTETLIKVKPKKARVVCNAHGLPVPLNDEARPARPPDASNSPLGDCWIEGAEWFYGGVGYAGFNSAHAGGGCACWFSRFALDGFARSIVPEVHSFSVAVLDSSGNLILRVGRLGNVDDGKPLVAGGGSPHPALSPAGRGWGEGARSIGGDEVALFHACYVATHTDRRLFISDVGNGRIVAVKLGYHAEEKVALKGVSDRAGK